MAPSPLIDSGTDPDGVARMHRFAGNPTFAATFLAVVLELTDMSHLPEYRETL
ncbi:hypothetical protein GCM10027268_08890 [Brachybacterium huguangmaarense]